MKVRYQIEELVRTADYESVKISIALEEDFKESSYEAAVQELREVVQKQVARDVRLLKKKRGIK